MTAQSGQARRLARLLAPLATQAIDQMLRTNPNVTRATLESHVEAALERGIETYRARRAAEVAGAGHSAL